MNAISSRVSRRLRTAAAWIALGAVLGCGDSGEETKVAVDAEQLEASAEHADEVVLDSAAIAVAGIRLAPVATVETTGLAVTGTITYDANRVSHIGPRTEGRIVQLLADIGARAGAGQPLAVLESPLVGQIRAERNEAEALLRIAGENYERERRLEQQGISSRKELLLAEADLRRAQASLASATERLDALGAGGGQGSQFALTSPFAGIVVARDASLGEMANPASQLYTVANLDRLWIELDIFERDLSRIGAGQAVEITTTAYSGRSFPGTIVYVGHVLDPEKRTVRARVEVPNQDRALRPGMFATALIRVGGGGAPVVVVPQSAIQELEGQTVVFVPGDLPGEFRAQPVEVGSPADAGNLMILSGLQPGDMVVVAGAFALRSELAKGEIGEHGH